MKVHYEFSMLPLGAFRPLGRYMRLFSSDSPPPPDYTPLANASKESAEILAGLGREQLDFATLQYEENKPVLTGIANQQIAIAGQTAAQGQDYYDYTKSFRPVEQSLMYEAMGLTPDMVDALRAEQGAASQGILSGLVDESPYQAELEAARLAFEETPQQIGETTTTNITRPVEGQPRRTSPLSGFLGEAMKRSKATNEPIEQSIQEITKSNPEYAAALSRLTESQKKALLISAQNEALRSEAASAEASVLSKYQSQASRSAADKIAADKALDEADARIIGGTDSDVLAARHGEIEEGVGRAVADTQGGFTRNINQVIRQGLRYGGTPDAIGANAGAVGIQQASATAAAANAARAQGILNVRGQAGTNIDLRRNIADNVTKRESIGFAKKLDASGLVRGLPGASQGAYGLAVSAGNSAGANTQAPGQAYQAGQAAGIGTIGQGRQLYQQGLGSILQSQTSLYQPPADNTGAVIGAVGGIAVAI